MKEESRYLPIEFENNPWEDNENNIWLASTLSFQRNIEKYKFPGKLAGEKKKQIISLLSKEILSSDFLFNPALIKAEEISAAGKEFLVEHFLSVQTFQHTHLGEAFIIDGSGKFLAAINIRNHLSLKLIEIQEELESGWNRLIQLESMIGQTMSFAFSPRFGYLTADPMMCGTALQVFTYLHLPALIHMGILPSLLEKYADEGIAIQGFQGDPQEFIGDIVTLHNNYTLGLTEENIISNLRTMTTKLMVAEKSTRSLVQQEGKSDLKDKVSRAFAILLHSYQMEAVEAFNAISLLKMGLDLGWVGGTSHAELNALLFRIRRAHLLTYFGEQVPQEEIPHKRAEFIHEILQKIHLHV